MREKLIALSRTDRLPFVSEVTPGAIYCEARMSDRLQIISPALFDLTDRMRVNPWFRTLARTMAPGDVLAGSLAYRTGLTRDTRLAVAKGVPVAFSLTSILHAPADADLGRVARLSRDVYGVPMAPWSSVPYDDPAAFLRDSGGCSRAGFVFKAGNWSGFRRWRPERFAMAVAGGFVGRMLVAYAWGALDRLEEIARVPLPDGVPVDETMLGQTVALAYQYATRTRRQNKVSLVLPRFHIFQPEISAKVCRIENLFF